MIEKMTKEELLNKAIEDYPIGTKFLVAHIDHNPPEYTVKGGWRFESKISQSIQCEVEESVSYVPCLYFCHIREKWAEITKQFNYLPLIFN